MNFYAYWNQFEDFFMLTGTNLNLYAYWNQNERDTLVSSLGIN